MNIISVTKNFIIIVIIYELYYHYSRYYSGKFYEYKNKWYTSYEDIPFSPEHDDNLDIIKSQLEIDPENKELLELLSYYDNYRHELQN